MEFIGLNEIREKYLSFFEGKGHVRLESAPLIPKDDASILLIGAGMAPLKKYFTGAETPPGKRAVSCQRCVRTNDIENVGKTSRHCSFFEMLGNFSFGEYFKEEATDWAWEFLTRELKIPEDRLWPSVFEEDDEAFDIWTKRRGVNPERVVRLGRDDNFWELGPGPCGPCSEIYFDRGPEHGCDNPDCKPGCDCDRYVEVWNLVFTQFDSDGEGNYAPLSNPNIDTGMGLERIACVMQGVGNVMEVDTNRAILNHIAEIAGVKYGESDKTDFSLRVMTDHIRATVFMVGDGIIPQNEGRGYVLRRLLRRAARHGRLLGVKEEFLYKVCETVISVNKGAYPYLGENAAYIVKVIQVEEERFLRTIEQGLDILNNLIDEVQAKQIATGSTVIPGEDVFRLYDTFGFPPDLTTEIAADRGVLVDEEGFLKHMQTQRERARSARAGQGSSAWEASASIDMDFEDKFIGYEFLNTQTKILEIVYDKQSADEVREDQEAVIYLAETPFYAESGGQVGDTGIIHVGKNIFRVTDCRKSPSGHTMHTGKVISGFIAKGDEAAVYVDKRRRRAIMRNHTAAHLLQAALRKVLGEHVHQAGSFVSDEVCRFDFTHFSAVTPEQLSSVETAVNDMIMRGVPVTCSEMGMDEAKALGAIALFGDKYGDIVRVCNIKAMSVELCGGTHMSNTSQLGLFKIVSETSVAAGVRRIEAVSGRGVLAIIEQRDSLLSALTAALKVNGPLELEARAVSLSSQLRSLQKELDELKKKDTGGRIEALTENTQEIGPVRLIAAELSGADVDSVRASADSLKDKHPDIVGVLAIPSGDKASLLVFAGKKAVSAGVHAGRLVKELAAIAGGSGGGRPDNAMGGIADMAKISDAVSAAKDKVMAQIAVK